MIVWIIGIGVVTLFGGLMFVLNWLSDDYSVHAGWTDEEIETIPTKAVMLGSVNKCTEIIESELEKDNKILAEMTIASEDEPELHQCPCCPATTCIMDTPCLGCETYGEWLNEKK